MINAKGIPVTLASIPIYDKASGITVTLAYFQYFCASRAAGLVSVGDSQQLGKYAGVTVIRMFVTPGSPLRPMSRRLATACPNAP